MADRFVPAAGRAGLTALYDPVLRLTMREGTWRAALVAQALEGEVRPARIADVGCGTGTLTVALAAAAPGAKVVGVDGDPEVLLRARRKVPPGARVAFAVGMADALPLPDARFDRVTMSLLLHHLGPDAKRAALREARRILAPGGSLHVADWGRPQDPLMRGLFLGLRVLDGMEPTREHAAGALPAVVADAGFDDVRVRERLRTGFGTLELLSALRR